MDESVSGDVTWYRRGCADSACPEVAKVGEDFLLRSSDRPGEVVRFSAAEWAALREGIQAEGFPS